MEKQNRIVDDFFREALQNHVIVPTDAAKAEFLKEAATLPKPGRPRRTIYYFISGILFLALIGTLIYFGHQNVSLKRMQYKPDQFSSIGNSKSFINKEKDNHHESSLPLIVSNSKAISYGSNLQSKKVSPGPLTNLVNRAEQNKTAGSNQSVELALKQSNAVINDTSIIGNQNQDNSVSQVSSDLRISMKKIVTTNNPDSAGTAPTKSEMKSTTNLAMDVKEKEKNTSSVTPKNWSIDLGAYYSPELMFNTLEGEKYANNFGIEGAFHFGDYSIRTGAGLSITKGTNELSVNYKDFKGFYNHLDSISFVWDASHTHLNPTYYFTKTSVWDSLLKTQNARIIKRYTYLQIPFILGYDFWKNDYLSIGLRVGPILSILLKTEIISNNYNPGNDEIIQINYITPDRIDTYWQFMGGINIGLCLSRKIKLEAEPELRYYFNSVYEQPVNSKKPWSAGIRIAFLIKE
jgi:hypothetical protein